MFAGKAVTPGTNTARTPPQLITTESSILDYSMYSMVPYIEKRLYMNTSSQNVLPYRTSTCRSPSQPFPVLSRHCIFEALIKLVFNRLQRT